MSRSKSQTKGARAPSAVAPEMLDHYRAAARPSTVRDDVQTLRLLVDDYQALTDAGDLVRALGAGLELIGVALRIAATRSLTDTEWDFKKGFFDLHFPSMMGSLDHRHVPAIAKAALAAERPSANRRHAGPTF